jgi:hypothetical protein
MPTFAAGNNAKVTIGAATILGMGNWKMSGVTVDLLETTSFGDVAKTFITGLLDWGTATFSGLYDMSNTGGQSTLLSAMINNSKIAGLRLYLNSVSYWVANITHATLGSEAGQYVTGVSIGQDKSGLGTIDFTVKYTGPVVFQ